LRQIKGPGIPYRWQFFDVQTVHAKLAGGGLPVVAAFCLARLFGG
jgi:hypothetical protein